MARESMGKVLLRNVIRHTDAHNKIQEESEMWKMRDMEKTSCHKQISAMDGRRGHMHCDRMGSESRARSGSREHSSGRNEREARYWTRKLYEFEANDPDRWGHSGFKELYPEEFRIEGEGGAGDKSKHRKKKKSKCSSQTDKSKSSKKSSKKKKKKKEAKRKRERADRSGDEDRDEDSDTKRKRRTSSKSKPSKRRDKSRGKEESSSEDSGEEGAGEGRTQTHGKRQRNSDRGCQIGLEMHKKRRKNWKAPNEERSEGSSDE